MMVFSVSVFRMVAEEVMICFRLARAMVRGQASINGLWEGACSSFMGWCRF